jgi:hypothetical protein
MAQLNDGGKAINDYAMTIHASKWEIYVYFLSHPQQISLQGLHDTAG